MFRTGSLRQTLHTALANWSLRLLAVAVATACLGLAALAIPSTWKAIDEKGTDLIWRLTASEQPEQRIVFVDIDDRSLAETGPWPWPRAVLAELVTQLDQQGAALKLFDMVLPEPREGSQLLRAALQARATESPTLLGQVFALRQETTLHIGQPSGALVVQACPAAAVPAQGVIANTAQLNARAGHITPLTDPDGLIRRVPALVCYRGLAYPVLPLAGLWAASAYQASAPSFSVQPGVGWLAPAWQLQSHVLPGNGVGLDADGTLRVPYRIDRTAWTSVSAVDVLRNQVPPELLRNAWVVVGASAFGLSDTVPTALGSAVTGAEVHAQLLAALLDGQIPHTPKGAPLLQVAYLLAVGLALLTVSAGHPLRQSRRVLLLPLLGVVGAALAFLAHAALLLQSQLHVGWALPAVGSAVLGSALALACHAQTWAQKSRLLRHLSAYLPAPVAEQLALQPPSGAIQAQRQDVSVLAADIGNFTAYCEARSPEDTARVLHHFYTTASDIVARHGGVVEEMVGDSLLAVFNGPQPCHRHPESALAAARDIWLHCGEQLPNTTGQGLEPLSINIGLETGDALIGSIGSVERRVHTVLGLTVTVALRLRDMAPDLAYPILLGPGAAQRIPVRIDQPDTVLKPLGTFLLPGLRQPGKIFTLSNLLQPHSPADKLNLEYISQLSQTA